MPTNSSSGGREVAKEKQLLGGLEFIVCFFCEVRLVPVEGTHEFLLEAGQCSLCFA